MHKRLQIAKRLLTSDGIIFIHIDDNEIAQLKCLCDELFNSNPNPKQSNCLGVLVWNLGTGTNAGHFTRAHEYVLAYAKDKTKLSNFSGGEGKIDHSALKKISKKNPAVEYTFKAGTEFLAPDGTELFDNWGGSEKTYLVSGRMVAENHMLKYDVTLRAGFAMNNQMKSWFDGVDTVDSKGQHVVKFYFNSSGVLHYIKDRSIINPPSVLSDLGSTKTGSTELLNVLQKANMFGYPKPTELIKFLLSLKPNNIKVLDFFAGSGTTLNAVIQLNNEDGGNRQCLLVTNNENQICENVTYQRISRVIGGYVDDDDELIDGFESNTLRYYKTDFVARESSQTAKRELMAASTDMLCIKNDIYTENETFGGKKFRKDIVRFFENGDKQMLIIYNARAIETIVDIISGMTVAKPIIVYVFSLNDYAMDADFETVADKVSLCALPDAILRAYRRVLPKKRMED